MRILDLDRIPRLIDPVRQTNYKTLLVSGDSHTSMDFGRSCFYMETLTKCYNNIKDPSWPEVTNARDWFHLPKTIKQECCDLQLNAAYLTYVTWPVYCRDLLGLDNLVDCSCPGAGNKHIHDSVIWALESNLNYSAKNTFVVVMWTGHDRDDLIVDAQSIVPSNTNRYLYDQEVELCLTGGIAGHGNSIFDLDVLKKIKSDRSRSIENYVYIMSLYHYLSNKGYDFVFTAFSQKLRYQGLDIRLHLKEEQMQRLDSLLFSFPTLGDMTLDTVDGYHASPRWHQSWCKHHLLPQIGTIE